LEKYLAQRLLDGAKEKTVKVQFELKLFNVDKIIKKRKTHKRNFGRMEKMMEEL